MGEAEGLGHHCGEMVDDTLDAIRMGSRQGTVSSHGLMGLNTTANGVKASSTAMAFTSHQMAIFSAEFGMLDYRKTRVSICRCLRRCAARVVPHFAFVPTIDASPWNFVCALSAGAFPST